MDKQQTNEALQFFIADLNVKSFSRRLQTRVFGNIGVKPRIIKEAV